MSFLNRLAGLLGLSSSTPVAPPGAALAATVTVVSATNPSDNTESHSVVACIVGVCPGRYSL
jgi:predicted component of type VI protein secretion system